MSGFEDLFQELSQIPLASASVFMCQLSRPTAPPDVPELTKTAQVGMVKLAMIKRAQGDEEAAEFANRQALIDPEVQQALEYQQAVTERDEFAQQLDLMNAQLAQATQQLAQYQQQTMQLQAAGEQSQMQAAQAQEQANAESAGKQEAMQQAISAKDENLQSQLASANKRDELVAMADDLEGQLNQFKQVAAQNPLAEMQAQQMEQQQAMAGQAPADPSQPAQVQKQQQEAAQAQQEAAVQGGQAAQAQNQEVAKQDMAMQQAQAGMPPEQMGKMSSALLRVAMSKGALDRPVSGEADLITDEKQPGQIPRSVIKTGSIGDYKHLLNPALKGAGIGAATMGAAGGTLGAVRAPIGHKTRGFIQGAGEGAIGGAVGGAVGGILHASRAGSILKMGADQRGLVANFETPKIQKGDKKDKIRAALKGLAKTQDMGQGPVEEFLDYDGKNKEAYSLPGSIIGGIGGTALGAGAGAGLGGVTGGGIAALRAEKGERGAAFKRGFRHGAPVGAVIGGTGGLLAGTVGGMMGGGRLAEKHLDRIIKRHGDNFDKYPAAVKKKVEALEGSMNWTERVPEKVFDRALTHFPASVAAVPLSAAAGGAAGYAAQRENQKPKNKEAFMLPGAAVGALMDKEDRVGGAARSASGTMMQHGNVFTPMKPGEFHPGFMAKASHDKRGLIKRALQHKADDLSATGITKVAVSWQQLAGSSLGQRVAGTAGGGALGAGVGAIENIQPGRAEARAIDSKYKALAARAKAEASPNYVNKVRAVLEEQKAALDQVSRENPRGHIARRAAQGAMLGSVATPSAIHIGKKLIGSGKSLMGAKKAV